MMGTKTKWLGIVLATVVVNTAAFAERVTWRASGLVTSVETNAQFLPFTPVVGQSFVIDMMLENTGSPAPGAPTTGVMSYNNIFSAVVHVGNNQMVMTPSTTWATTLWNDYVIGANAYDYYNMPIVDAATQWEARWTVQTPVTSGTGPLTSLSVLQTPPSLNGFQFKQMALTPGGGSYAPAIYATLDIISVVNPNSPPPNQAGDSGGGGGTTLISLLLLAALHFATALRRLPTRRKI